jgi:hypothetical protein
MHNFRHIFLSNYWWQESDVWSQASYRYPILWEAFRKMWRKLCIYKCMLNVYKNQQNQQTGSRNLMGPKTLLTISGTYMTLVAKYQISAINSYWEKCDEKYLGWTDRGKTERINVVFSSKDTEKLLNVYIRSRKCFLFLEQQSLDLVFSGVCVTQSLIWRLWPNIRFLPSTVTEKNVTKNILDGRTEVKQYTPLPLGSGSITKIE